MRYLLGVAILLVVSEWSRAYGYEESAWKWGWDAIAAIATAILAVVTGFLVSYTKKLWRSTSELVRETANVELPFLIPELIRLEPDRFGDGTRPMVTYTFRNHGKTPAIIRRFQDRLRLMDHLPDSEEEIYGEEQLSARPGQYIACGPSHVPIEQGQTNFLCRLDPADIPLIGQQVRFYLIGRIQYEDLNGRSFVQGFCVQILENLELRVIPPVPLRYVRTGDVVYNYRREVSPRENGMS